MTVALSQLSQAFAARPGRFRLLDRSLGSCLPQLAPDLTVLEFGCGEGEATAHLARTRGWQLTGIDLDGGRIARGQARFSDLIQTNRVQLLQADLATLTQVAGPFDFIFGEAAFSPLTDKDRSLQNLYRLLKAGGWLLLLDFAIHVDPGPQKRRQLDYIPCFAGVKTLEKTAAVFQKAGFELCLAEECKGELIRLALWLASAFDVPLSEVGPLLRAYVNCEESCSQTSFFSEAKLTYARWLFRKPDQKG